MEQLLADSPVLNSTEGITRVEYNAFQDAYDFFNTELFGGSLPHVLVTLQRRAHSKGYFSPERFDNRVVKTTVHEVALNPDCFTNRSDQEILSTLVHEQTHVWQKTFGNYRRPGYHNKEWAAKMKEIGLQPSNTGFPGGKETGQQMTHYIIKDGPFAKAYAKLNERGFQLHWQSADYSTQKNPSSKTKFTCLQCGQNAWGKPDALLICGHCSEVDVEDQTISFMWPAESAPPN
jgi:predicted SprT family Zn-dependent metalloprotease